MKKYYFIIGILLSLFTGCKQVDKITQFELSYTENTTIPATFGMSLPITVYTPEIQSESENEMSVHDTRKDMIEHVTVKELNLSIISPDNEDFSFLKSIHVYIKADGLDKVEVAWKDPVLSTVGNTLTLDLSGADMQEYIKKDSFSLEVASVTDEIISQDITIQIDAVFFVDAKILGQ